tara:strand:- start:3252 stop:3713 length:462 start_codon:yes stop_codon:yes gene_type:complete
MAKKNLISKNLKKDEKTAFEQAIKPHEKGILFTGKSAVTTAVTTVDRVRHFLNNSRLRTKYIPRIAQYYDAYVRKNPYSKDRIETEKALEKMVREKFRKEYSKPPLGIAAKAVGPLAAAIFSPFKASAPNVVDLKTGINKYTGKKEYTPIKFQ